MPGFLDDLRAALKAGTFRPLPVRERKIPKPGRVGKGPQARDSDDRGPGCPGGAEAGAGADLRGGLRAVSRTGSGPGGGPRTRSPRSTITAPAATAGCWTRTSRRAFDQIVPRP